MLKPLFTLFLEGAGKYPQEPGQAWPPKGGEDPRGAKDINKQFPGMMGFDPYDANTLRLLQNGNLGDLNALVMKQQQQAQAARNQNPFGFDNNNLFKGKRSIFY